MSSSDLIARRFTCITGIVSAACYGVVAGCLVNSPDITASGQDILEWGINNRTTILTAVYFEGLCVMFTTSFLVGFSAVLRRSEGTTGLWSTLAMISGVSIFTVALGGMVYIAAYGFRAGGAPGFGLSADQARLLVDMSLLMICLTGFPTAISQFAYATSLWTMPHPARIRGSWWLALSGTAIGILHMISGGCFSTAGGMLSPSGLGLMVCPVLYYIWFVAVSLCLVLTPMEDRVIKSDLSAAIASAGGGSGRQSLLGGGGVSDSPELNHVGVVQRT